MTPMMSPACAFRHAAANDRHGFELSPRTHVESLPDGDTNRFADPAGGGGGAGEHALVDTANVAVPDTFPAASTAATPNV
jgi:hypothetical protein